MGVYSLTRSGINNWVKYSSMLAGNQPAVSDYELISTTVVSSPVASVTFNIPESATWAYKHLQIRMSAVPGADMNVYMRLNGDSGANYSYHGMQGYVTGINSFSVVSTTQMFVGYTSAGSTFPSVAVIDLLDPFSSSKNKTMRALFGSIQSSNSRIMLMSSAWYNTAAITSISILQNAANWGTGSRFSLYGLR